MTKYREILRLSSLGLSQQNIADSCNVSKKTINRVLKRAKELDISWPLDENDTDAVLAEKFFPSANQVTSNKRMPDYDYTHKEFLRNGVSKFLEHGTLNAMFRLLNPKLDNLWISRYLVIMMTSFIIDLHSRCA